MLEAFIMTAFFPIFMFIWVLAVGGAFLYHLSLYVIILVVGICKATIFIFIAIYELLIVIYKAMVFILKKTYENLQGILATLVIVYMALAVFLDWV